MAPEGKTGTQTGRTLRLPPRLPDLGPRDCVCTVSQPDRFLAKHIHSAPGIPPCPAGAPSRTGSLGQGSNRLEWPLTCGIAPHSEAGTGYAGLSQPVPNSQNQATSTTPCPGTGHRHLPPPAPTARFPHSARPPTREQSVRTRQPRAGQGNYCLDRVLPGHLVPYEQGLTWSTSMLRSARSSSTSRYDNP
jgi:hypothetical protein